jgi:uncharacterized membrane protein
LAALAPPLAGAAMLLAGAGETLAVLGKGFKDNRYISVTWLILPLIGLLEREGLQERAKTLIQRLKSATTGRLLDHLQNTRGFVFKNLQARDTIL